MGGAWFEGGASGAAGHVPEQFTGLPRRCSQGVGHVLLEHFAGQLFDATVVEGVEQQLRVMSGAQQAVEQILAMEEPATLGKDLAATPSPMI